MYLLQVSIFCKIYKIWHPAIIEMVVIDVLSYTNICPESCNLIYHTHVSDFSFLPENIYFSHLTVIMSDDVQMIHPIS